MGSVSELKYGNGLKIQYEYDRLNRLVRLAGFDKKGKIIDDRKIKYDAAGRKIMTDIVTSDRINETGKQYPESGRRDFTYDKKGQLIKVKHENGNFEEYSYDSFGNRTISKIRDFNGFRTENYYYDTLNRLIGIKEKNGEKVFEYDNRGNLLKVRKDNEILENYIYDRTNRLIRAENSNKIILSFMYDGNGRRVRKENLYGVSEYVPDYTDEYSRILLVNRKNGIESLIYGNGLIKSQNCGESFCHFENEMTSVMRITDNAGKTKRILQYSPFGNVYDFGKIKDIERTPISFTGYECEENLNIMYAQARYYLPKAGRFAEEDSNKGNAYLPESLNYYTYCDNDSINYVDFNGKEKIPLTTYVNTKSKDFDWNSNNKSAKVNKNAIVSTNDEVITANNAYNERSLVFRAGKNYVYEIYNDGEYGKRRIHILNNPITIEKRIVDGEEKDTMLVEENDLKYIFLCAAKENPDSAAYDKTIPIEKVTRVSSDGITEDITKLYFTQTGNPIIYVDNPESIYNMAEKYFYYFEMQKGIYTVEFYSWCQDKAALGYYDCIIVYDENEEDIGNNSSEITIQGSGLSATKEGLDSTAITSLKTQNSFLSRVEEFSMSGNKNSNNCFNIHYKEALVLLSGEYNGKSSFLNGKIKFEINKNLKLVVCNLKDINKYLDKLHKPSKTLYNKIYNMVSNYNKYEFSENFTTSYMKYDTVKAKVFVTVGTKFFLCNSGEGFKGLREDNKEYTYDGCVHNINEFQELPPYSVGYEKEKEEEIKKNPELLKKRTQLGKKIHMGNYSIIYEIQLLYSDCSKLKIVPNHSEQMEGYKTFMIYYNNNWEAIERYKDKHNYVIDIPKDGFFKFLLPGGNCGDVLFEIL